MTEKAFFSSLLCFANWLESSGKFLLSLIKYIMEIKVHSVLVILGSLMIDYCICLPSGAPTGACYGYIPRHGRDYSEQVDYKSYFLITSEKTGNGDNSVKVILKAVDNSRLFKGFLVRAVPGTYDPANWEDQPTPIGTWRVNTDNKGLSCFSPGNSNTVTHTDNDLKSEATFIWIPPMYQTLDRSNKTVTFVATVVEHKERFFSGVTSETIDIK